MRGVPGAGAGAEAIGLEGSSVQGDPGAGAGAEAMGLEGSSVQGDPGEVETGGAGTEVEGSSDPGVS